MKIRKIATLLCLTVLLSGVSGAYGTPAQAASFSATSTQVTQVADLANKYKSCSYPKGPAVVRAPNAASWEAQGFGDVIRGIDVSRWNHPNNKPIDFAKLKSTYGITFVVIKSSDGGASGNALAKKWYPIDRKAALAQGLVVGGYHYALPGNLATDLTKDAKLQAARAVRQANGAKVGDLPLTLDMEELPCGWSHSQLAKWTDTFLKEAKRLTGRTPIIYMNGTFIKRLVEANVADFSSYPLWLAKWGPKLGTDPGAASVWPGKWTIWQFTADGKVDGVLSKNTDLNVFNGSGSDFQAFISR
jgi:GH25 family lysozyme M1 (1,4-beta-N-acetylmuramidase)